MSVRAFGGVEWFGGVFAREARASGRRRSTYAVRAMYVLVVLGAAYLTYASLTGELEDAGGRGVGAMQSVQRLAPLMMITVMSVQAGLLALLGPSMTAGSLSDERQKRTLDVLLTTPLRPWQIVMGKLMSGMMTLGILSLTSLPLLLAVRVFGGVEAGVVLSGTAVGLAVGLLGASGGVFNSVWARKASTASFIGLLYVAGASIAPFLVVASLGSMSGQGPTGWVLDVMSMSPMFAMTVLLSRAVDAIGVPVPIGTGRVLVLCLGYMGLMSAVFLTLATVTLRRVMLATGAGAGPSASVEGEGAGKGARRRVREVSDRPVLWREMRQPMFRRRFVGVLAVLAVAGLVIWVFTTGSRVEQYHFHLVCQALLALAVMHVSAVSSSAVSGEREARTWEVLMVAPVSAWSVLVGKFLGSLRRTYLMPAALGAVVLGLGVLAGRMTGMTAAWVLLVVAGPVVLMSALGTVFGLVIKKGGNANGACVGVGLGLWAVLPITFAVMPMLVWGGWSGKVPEGFERMMEGVLVMNPFAMLSASISGGYVDRGGGSGAVSLPFSGRSVSYTGYTALMAGVMLGYWAVALGVLWVGRRVFNRRAGRTS
ncbi:MAG: ABC transporter permease subunit [Phycisphaeraceae bacterium]|nr:MAG: ABC transporter permease subunit [Phycisphaeraceae bacterium]